MSVADLDALAAQSAPDTARSAPAIPEQSAEPGGLRTEFDFELPRGYLDEQGRLHRTGRMRLATARDELRPQVDVRVKENPGYLSVVLLAQVITRLGTITDIHPGVVERMYATDIAFLQEFYRRVNSEGHTRAGVRCPTCETEFEVELAGGRLGES